MKEIQNNMKKIKENLTWILFLLIFAIFSIYHYLPVEIHAPLLRVPYYVLIALGIFAIYKIIKSEKRMSKFTKTVIALNIALGSVYIFITVIRFLRVGMSSARPSFYLALAVLVPFIVYLCYEVEVFLFKNIKRDIVIVISIVNIGQIISGLTTFGGVRSSLILENIMVYNNVAIMLLPVMLKILNESKNKIMNISLIANFVINLTFISVSGSRSGMLIAWVVFGVSMLLSVAIYRKKSLISNTVITLLTASFILIFYTTGLFNATNSLERLQLEDAAAEMVYETPDSNDDYIPEIIPEVVEPEPIFVDPYEFNVIEQSNAIRSNLWEQSMNEIRESPIIGTGRVAFYVTYGEMTFLQGSHNVFMEIWLVFGGIGLLAYVILFAILIFYLVKQVFARDNRKFTLLFFVISIGSSFTMALVQPLLVMLIPNLMLWLVIIMGVNESTKTKKL